MYTTKNAKPTKKVSLIPPSSIPIWPESLSSQVYDDVTKPSDPAAAAQEAWRSKQRRVKIGTPGQRIFSLGGLLFGAAGAWSAVLLLFLVWWRPHLGLTGGATGLGLLGGVLAAWLYYGNCKKKLQYQQVLSMDPGLKGCQFLLGTLPSWISLTEREKMEWLNKLLTEVWPYYDRGICSMVKEIAEPIMDQYRPPIFKRIFFQELTFGEAPVRIEGIAVRNTPDEIDLEIDVRWSGDANISLAIEAQLPSAISQYARLTPKVKDIVFVATIKVILKPLVEKVPGFAAAAVALKSPPIIRYRLDFGGVPSAVTSIVTVPLLSFIDLVVNQVIVGMLLWPKRITVPILSWNGVLPANDPDVDLEVERLNGRQCGVIKVTIIQAKDLKSYDVTGKSDPFVEIFTTTDHRSATRVINSSLTPVWEEVKYLPVFEKDQILKLEVFDYDAVNIKENLLNMKDALSLKGSKEFMGRAAVPLAQFISEEGLEDEFWVPLGKGDWTNMTGPGMGEGMCRLGLQYRAVENIAGEEILKAKQGLLLVGVIRCHGLVSATGKNVSSYVQLKMRGNKTTTKDVYKTPVIKANRSPRWPDNNKFTFYDVQAADTLCVTVVEPGMTAMTEDELGTLSLFVPDIIESRQVSRWTGTEQAGYVYKTYMLENGDGGRIELEIEFLPYW